MQISESDKANKINVLKDELAEIDRQIVAWKAQIQGLEGRIARAEYGRTFLEERLADLGTTEPLERSSSFKQGVTIWEAAEIVLREAGHPMRPSELARAILLRGYQTKTSETFQSSVTTGLSRHPEIFRKNESGWDLVKRGD
jgi:hypothetical protein